jgi:L-threonylcarbamoyladenylate synthase
MTLQKTKLLKPEGTWTAEVKSFFDLNEPVALPTETVYGLAAPASNAKAVARIYEIKERPSFNPLILPPSFIETCSSNDFILLISYIL